MKRSSSVFVGALLVAVSCRQIVGIDDREAAESLAPECGAFEFSLEACGECSETRCCAAFERCRNAAACAAALSCLSACDADDIACRSNCRRSFPNGFDDVLAGALACQSAACSFECKLACGGYIAAFDECSKCIVEDCCAESQECTSSAACLELTHCTHACGQDPTCVDDCRLAHPEGEELANNLGQCAKTFCGEKCGSWSCLGKLAPKTAPPGPLGLFAIRLLDSSNQPLIGLEVRACARTDMACETPEALGKLPSEESGTVYFFDSLPSGFDGYFEVSGNPIAPNLVFTPEPALPHGGLVVQMVDSKAMGELEAVLGPADPTRGQVLVKVSDCTGGPAKGVSVSFTPIDGASKRFYLRGGIATATASSTDESGVAGLWNVPADQSTEVQAKTSSSSVPIATHTIWVRKGAVTQQIVFPKP